MNTAQSNSIQTLIDALQKPRFTIRDSEVERRNIAHWGLNDLLIGEYEPGKWRRLNYVEILWLRIVAHMRSFDVPLEKIKMVKDAIGMESIPLWSFYQELGITEEDMVQKYPTRISSLTSMVMIAILFRSRFVIIVTREGEVKSFDIDVSDQAMAFFYRKDLRSKTFLCISITEVLFDSFRMITPDILCELMVVTPNEAEVVNLLRVHKLSSVKVLFEDGREPDLFEIADEADRIQQLFEMIWPQDYHRITWASTDGRVTYFDRVNRLNPKPELPDGGSVKP
jgi:hypothetical protein